MLLREILEFNTLRNPGKEAIWFDDGRRESFEGLYARAMGLAQGLSRHGKAGDRIAMLADNCPEYVEAYYGVPSARQALVFLNYRLAAPEIARILNDAGPTILIYAQAFEGLAEAACAELEHPPELYSIGGGKAPDYESLIESDRTPPMPDGEDENDLAWLIYTSGTTGMPKGAMISHRNLIFSSMNAQSAFASDVPDPRYLFPFPMCHIAGYAILTQHLRGTPVVLMRQFDPEGWLEQVQAHRITGTALAPTMINMILNHPKINDYDTSSLDNIGYGASSIPAGVLSKAIRRFGNVFTQGFGMTELAGNVAFMSRDTHVRAIEGEAGLLSAAGKPGSLAGVRIVDEQQRNCPPGVPGEIIVRGDQVLTGYWRRPDAEAEAFRDGWFHTGDMGRWDEEGFLYIVDRKKDMIVSGGENIYPREVEDALHQHPAVMEAAVFGTPDDHWGERVNAAVVKREGEALDASELEQFLRAELAGYKVPRRIHFVAELPKNVSGKILKRELRSEFQSA